MWGLPQPSCSHPLALPSFPTPRMLAASAHRDTLQTAGPFLCHRTVALMCWLISGVLVVCQAPGWILYSGPGK